jgi:hypothetical protein
MLTIDLNLSKYENRIRGTLPPVSLSGSRLGGVVVSVFATRPKPRGFKPSRCDGFLRAIKIRSTPSFA